MSSMVRPTRVRVEVEVRDIGISMHILSIRRGRQGGWGRRSVMLIHGAASSAASFAPMFDRLSLTHDVYAVDVPGFGRSHVHGDDGDIELLVDAMEALRVSLDIEHPCWVGHSFGAYLVTLYAITYPSHAHGLVLMNPVGIFPTLGSMGAYWAVAFRWSIQNLASSSPWAANHPRAFGGRIIADCISGGWTPYWRYPLFDHIAYIDAPISLIYGEDDEIAPAHQGYIIQAMYACQFTTLPTGHSITAGTIDTVANNIVLFSKKPAFVIRTPVMTRSWARYMSSFNPREAARTIDRMYAALGREYGISLRMDDDISRFRWGS